MVQNEGIPSKTDVIINNKAQRENKNTLSTFVASSFPYRDWRERVWQIILVVSHSVSLSVCVLYFLLEIC
jgi:hypothetical protein